MGRQYFGNEQRVRLPENSNNRKMPLPHESGDRDFGGLSEQEPWKRG